MVSYTSNPSVLWGEPPSLTLCVCCLYQPSKKDHVHDVAQVRFCAKEINVYTGAVWEEGVLVS